MSSNSNLEENIFEKAEVETGNVECSDNDDIDYTEETPVPPFKRRMTECVENDEWEKPQPRRPENMKAAVTDRNDKAVLTLIMFIFGILLFAMAESDTTMNNKIVLLLGTTLFTFNGHLWWVVYNATALYRVRVFNRRLSNWAPLSLPYHIIAYPKYPVSSISELVAMRGNILSKHLSVMMFTFAFLTVMCTWPCVDGDKLSHRLMELQRVLIVGAPCGGAILSLWDLDVFDEFHIIVHLIGVAMASCAVFGLALARNFDWVSLGWIGAAFVSGTVYLIAATFFIRKNDDLSVVTRRSRILVVVESFFLIIQGTAVMRYIADGTECALQ